MQPHGETDAIRTAAIDHHHDEAPRFERWYNAMAESRFSNAFTYGRYKVDVLLERELGRLPKGAEVLDVGCGTGIYLQRLAERGLTPHGLEPAPAMLDRAKAGNPGVDVRQGVATELPYADASLDAVMAIEVFRYLDHHDTERSLREMHRVLKPGGFAFYTMVNRWALDGFWVLQRMRQLATRSSFDRKHPHCEFFTPDEVRTLTERAGFENVQIHGRMLASLRIAYKLGDRVGSSIARKIEPVDDSLHQYDALTPFAGHLVAVAYKK